MKYHLVFDNNGKFRGYLADKLDVHLFKSQRDMDQFTINTISDKEFEKRASRILDIGNYEAINMYGIIMFPEEELFMFESFDQMLMDFRATMGHILRDYRPYVKFTDDEFEKVEAAMLIMFNILEESNIIINDYENEEVYDHNQHFKMNYMAKHIINSFGGKD